MRSDQSAAAILWALEGISRVKRPIPIGNVRLATALLGRCFSDISLNMRPKSTISYETPSGPSCAVARQQLTTRNSQPADAPAITS
jgi:hypothetical protein